MNGATPDEQTSQIEVITPEIAGDYLAQNTHNRVLQRPEVDRLAAAITADEWQLTHQGIAFDQAGRLVDGQHRLWAVVVAKRPVPMWVTRGVDPEAFPAVDIGRRRTSGDILGLRGEHDGRDLAAALGWLWRYEQGQMLATARAATPATLIDLLAQHPDMREAVIGNRGHRRRYLLAPAIAAWLRFEFQRIDGDQADRFFEQLASGAGLAIGDPVLALRERLQEHQRQTARERPWVTAAWAIKAWNAVMTGRRLKSVRVAPKEPFPLITGRTTQPGMGDHA